MKQKIEIPMLYYYKGSQNSSVFLIRNLEDIFYIATGYGEVIARCETGTQIIQILNNIKDGVYA